MNRETKKVMAEINEIDEEMKYPTGYEDAIIGTVERFGISQTLILVDKEKMLEMMVKRDKMTREEAIEYFQYNVIGAWMGEGTPCFATIMRKK